MGKIELKYIAGKDSFKEIPRGTAVLYNEKNRFEESHWYSGIINDHVTPPLCPNGTEGVFIKPTDNRIVRNQRMGYDVLRHSGNDYLIEVKPDFFKTELGAMEGLWESLSGQMNVLNEVTQQILSKGGSDQIILAILCDLPTIQKEYVHRYS